MIDALATRDLLDLVRDVCRTHSVKLDDVCGRHRSLRISRARQEIWWRLRHHPEHHFGFAEIGRLFARDHATVMHGVDAHQRRRAHRSADEPPRP